MILLISVRLLDNRYHGLTDNGERAEWPPSPFRLFQALVAGNARGIRLSSDVVEALQWLEKLDPPQIVAPKTEIGQVILTYVLNNTEGRSRTPKVIRPTLLNGDRLIQYLWKFDPNVERSRKNADLIAKASRHIRALGWGIDMAFGHGEIIDAAPPELQSRIQYIPADEDDAIGIDFRSPRPGSLASLQECYAQYLNRFESNETTQLESGGPIYHLQPYLIGKSRPRVVFKLLDDNLDTARYPQALLTHIAAVVRHTAIECMKDGRNAPSWMSEGERGPWVSRFVRGKNDPPRDDHQQISYVPLPSIGHEHSDAMIRNVMLIAPIGRERELEYVAARLDGASLQFKDTGEECDTDTPPRVPLPQSIQRFNPPKGKFIDKCYLGRSKVWQSVTPVILDEHIHRKTREANDGQKIKYRDPEDFRRLIILALHRADIETPCRFIWQTLPFYRNCLTAHRYDPNKRPNYLLPKRLDGKTAVHLRIEFEQSIPGPITLGAGRHCGFGLMAGIG
jgi:CRISPR-associated protein Csb2